MVKTIEKIKISMTFFIVHSHSGGDILMFSF